MAIEQRGEGPERGIWWVRQTQPFLPSSLLPALYRASPNRIPRTRTL